MKSILRTSESSMAKFSLLVCWNVKIGIKIYKSAILAQPKMDLRKLKWYVLFNWTSLNGPQKAPKVPRNYVFSLSDAKISNYENFQSKNNTYKHYLCRILLWPLIHTYVPGKWIVNKNKAIWYSAFLVKDKTTHNTRGLRCDKAQWGQKQVLFEFEFSYANNVKTLIIIPTKIGNVYRNYFGKTLGVQMVQKQYSEKAAKIFL